MGKDLGVRYVLEGSVRKSGNKLRVIAQLIDAQTNQHLWSERYDRELKDIFAVQDDITKKIITELQIKLTEGEQARLWAKGTDDLDAYLKYLQGIGHLKFNKEENNLMRRLAEEAIELDAQYSNAYSLLGLSHAMDIWLKNTESPKDSIQKALELAKKAIDLDKSNAFAFGLMGYIYTMMEQHEKGIASAERAVALEPNSAMALEFLGFALRFGDRPNDAISAIEKSLRLDPFAPVNTIFSLGFSYLYAGRYEDAILPCQKAIGRDPDNLGAYLCLAYAYSATGRDKEARSIANEIIRIEPNFSIEYFSKSHPHKNKSVKKEFMSALRKAGLK